MAEDQTRQMQRRHLRRFGLTVGCAFLVLAALLFWKQRPLWPLFAGLSGAFLLLGVIWPPVLGPIERIWMKAARVMGWFMTRVILGLVFVLLFAPAGLVIRLLGKDPLELRRDPQARSYWHRRSPRDAAPEKMERMF
ncbi:MAG: hypothetical protein GF330_01910 [Candidatus Eisenbacteria bacterium]|nr:hypothetical protein [Candidatus Eisenbacteria bacterium]